MNKEGKIWTSPSECRILSKDKVLNYCLSNDSRTFSVFATEAWAIEWTNNGRTTPNLFHFINLVDSKLQLVNTNSSFTSSHWKLCSKNVGRQLTSVLWSRRAISMVQIYFDSKVDRMKFVTQQQQMQSASLFGQGWMRLETFRRNDFVWVVRYVLPNVAIPFRWLENNDDIETATKLKLNWDKNACWNSWAV